MKSLPVVQDPRGQAVPDEPGSSQGRQPETTGMVNDAAKAAEFSPRIIQVLKTVFDPEIPVDIYELGLIYDIIVDASGSVGIRMTLTAPACPAAQFLPSEVKKKVAEIPGVADVKLDVVWDPPWDRDRMSDAARLQLGLF
jgi:FeS assembly SUF system protein